MPSRPAQHQSRLSRNPYSWTSTALACSNPTSAAYPAAPCAGMTPPCTGVLIGSQRSAVTLTAVKSLCETVRAASAMTRPGAEHSHARQSREVGDLIHELNATTTRPGAFGRACIERFVDVSGRFSHEGRVGIAGSVTRLAIAASERHRIVDPLINPIDSPIEPIDDPAPPAPSTFFCSDNALVPRRSNRQPFHHPARKKRARNRRYCDEKRSVAAVVAAERARSVTLPPSTST